MGSPVDAVTYYTSAYKTSKDAEKEGLIARLKEAVAQLDSKEIVSMLRRMEGGFPTGYLLYQLGLNHFENEAYEDAAKVLSTFSEGFPRHARTQDAQRLLGSIEIKSVYSRYTIGCLLPFSGRLKAYGNQALKGVELALSRFSSQNGRPLIKIIFKDTESDPDKGVQAVKELFKENVAAIIGPLVTAEAAAMEAQNCGIPIITLTQKEDITQIGDYVFRNFLTPKMQVKAIVSFAAETLGLRNYAILYPDENYGTTFMNLFWDEVLAHGGRVVGAEAYNSAQTDFADPIKKLVGLYYEVPKDLKVRMAKAYKAEKSSDLIENSANTDRKVAGPAKDKVQKKALDPKDAKEQEPEPIVDFEAVFIPDAPKKAGLIIPQLAFYDIRNTYLLGTNLWHSDSLIAMSPQSIEGAVITDGFFAESAAAGVRDFVQDFVKTYGEEPEFIEAVAYDTAMILFEMVSRPDIRFRSELKKGLLQLSNFEGVTGLTSFESNGDVRKKLYLLKIKGKGFVELERR
jgi:ABC-type branched-subunit amino acid transport system substrate-binding protein